MALTLYDVTSILHYQCITFPVYYTTKCITFPVYYTTKCIIFQLPFDPNLTDSSFLPGQKSDLFELKTLFYLYLKSLIVWFAQNMTVLILANSRNFTKIYRSDCKSYKVNTFHCVSIIIKGYKVLHELFFNISWSHYAIPILCCNHYFD